MSAIKHDTVERYRLRGGKTNYIPVCRPVDNYRASISIESLNSKCSLLIPVSLPLPFNKIARIKRIFKYLRIYYYTPFLDNSSNFPSFLF